MFDTTSRLVSAQVNLFRNSFDPTPVQTMTLEQALHAIRLGRYANDVRVVRHILEVEGQAAYRRAKEQLPAFTFAGTFTPSRKIAHLRQHTGILHGDIDHLPNLDAVIEARDAISHCPCTAYCFVSPSFLGLKVGVRVPIVTDDPAYKYAWQVVSAEYEQKYGGRWDPSGKDISRLCYVSLDPSAYINLQAIRFDVPPAPTPEPPRPQSQRPSIARPLTNYQDYGARAIQTATQMIQSAALGARHHARLRAARLLGGYVASHLLHYEEALSALSRALEGHTEDMAKALKTVADGLAYGEAYPISLDALEAERQSWIDAHRPASPKTRQPPAEHDPWEGRRTLPLKPYQGLRLGRTVRRG